jgi:hypothetical protein
MFDESAPWGIRGYENAVYLDELTDESIDVIARHVPRKASPMPFMPVFVLGGRYAEPAEEDTASGEAAGPSTHSTSPLWHQRPN